MAPDRSIDKFIFLTVLMAGLTAGLLLLALYAEALDHRGGGVATELAHLVAAAPLGRAYPSDIFSDYTGTQALRIVLAPNAHDFVFISESVSFRNTSRVSPVTVFFIVGLLVLPVHTLCFTVLLLLHTHISEYNLLRSRWFRWRSMSRPFLRSLALAAPLPALAHFVWFVWSRVPHIVTDNFDRVSQAALLGETTPRPFMSIQSAVIPPDLQTILIDRLTRNTMSIDHFHGVAAGPVGQYLVLAGFALIYFRIVAHYVRRLAARTLNEELSRGTSCLYCRYTLAPDDGRCPECGNVLPTPPVRVTLRRKSSKLNAPALRWIPRVLLLGLTLAFLFSPLILGWINAMLPDPFWVKYGPY